jgi:polyhydroxyalkanoate synthesis regulator phasin
MSRERAKALVEELAAVMEEAAGRTDKSSGSSIPATVAGEALGFLVLRIAALEERIEKMEKR